MGTVISTLKSSARHPFTEGQEIKAVRLLVLAGFKVWDTVRKAAYRRVIDMISHILMVDVQDKARLFGRVQKDYFEISHKLRESEMSAVDMVDHWPGLAFSKQCGLLDQQMDLLEHISHYPLLGTKHEFGRDPKTKANTRPPYLQCHSCSNRGLDYVIQHTLTSSTGEPQTP